ncbi:MAG: DUF4295 family protein [Cyclonatronaceae bacterium]
MAKKQTFGDKVLAAKLAQRKMAKVIVSSKSDNGIYKFRESVVDAEKVNEFIARHRK